MVQLLQPCALDERVLRIESITANRTFSVLPIVEGGAVTWVQHSGRVGYGHSVAQGKVVGQASAVCATS